MEVLKISYCSRAVKQSGVDSQQVQHMPCLPCSQAKVRLMAAERPCKVFTQSSISTSFPTSTSPSRSTKSASLSFNSSTLISLPISSAFSPCL